MHLPASLLQSLPAWTFTFLHSCLLLMTLSCRFCTRLVFISQFCTDSVFSPIFALMLCSLWFWWACHPICEVHLATNWWHHLTSGSTIFAPMLHFLATAATLPQPYFFCLLHNSSAKWTSFAYHKKYAYKSKKKIVLCARLKNFPMFLFLKNYQELSINQALITLLVYHLYLYSCLYRYCSASRFVLIWGANVSCFWKIISNCLYQSLTQLRIA